MLRRTKSGTETQRYIDINASINTENILFTKLNNGIIILTAGMTLNAGNTPVRQIVATAFLNEKFSKIAKTMFPAGHNANYDITFACTNDMIIPELSIELPENLADDQDRKLTFEFGLAFTGLTEHELGNLVNTIGRSVSPMIYVNHPR